MICKKKKKRFRSFLVENIFFSPLLNRYDNNIIIKLFCIFPETFIENGMQMIVYTRTEYYAEQTILLYTVFGLVKRFITGSRKKKKKNHGDATERNVVVMTSRAQYTIRGRHRGSGRVPFFFFFFNWKHYVLISRPRQTALVYLFVCFCYLFCFFFTRSCRGRK